jgi:hypothetical protein
LVRALSLVLEQTQANADSLTLKCLRIVAAAAAAAFLTLPSNSWEKLVAFAAAISLGSKISDSKVVLISSVLS